MSVPTPTSVDVLERQWWARLPRLFYAPAGVFAELRDESREAADARQEPLVAIIFLAGIAMFLVARRARAAVRALPRAERAHADRRVDLRRRTGRRSRTSGSAAPSSTSARAGSERRPATVWRGISPGSRRSPFVVLLVLAWPVRLGLYGFDLFRTGGGDTGAGSDVFIALDALALAWTLVLVVIGVRQTQRWSWSRSAAALGVVALFAILFGTLAFAATSIVD